MSIRYITKVVLCFLLIISNGCILALSSKDLPIESDHPYSNNDERTWTINRSGADQMRLHFEYIRLAPDDYMMSKYDKITLSDKYNNVLAGYGSWQGSGMNSKVFWTDWYPKDTIKVTLVTNMKNFDDGFKIDDVQTRLDETNESSENTDNSKYTVSETPNVPRKDENKVLTTTNLTSSPNPSTLGQSVKLIAKVDKRYQFDTSSEEGEEPSGTVNFMDETTFIGSAEVVSGQASLTTSALPVGSHLITAKYIGDINFKSSTSPASTMTVINSVLEQQLRACFEIT